MDCNTTFCILISGYLLHSKHGSASSIPVLRRNVPALTPSQKQKIIHKRASWSPAGANVPAAVFQKAGHKRVPSDEKSHKTEMRPFPHSSMPNGVDLLQFNQPSVFAAADHRNPIPDLLGMCDANSASQNFAPFISAHPAISQVSLSKPLPHPSRDSVLLSQDLEFASVNVPLSKKGIKTPLLPKKVRFDSSSNCFQRQRSLLDEDMGEANDVHNALMTYTPETCTRSDRDRLLIDFNV